MPFNLPSYKINVDFTASTQSIEPGTSVTFTNISGGNPTQYFWNFGNGQTSTQSTAVVTYASAGTYSVSLLSANENAGGYKMKSDFIIVVGTSDPDISNFLTAIDETPESTIGEAITDLVVGLKSNGIWSKMKAIYPFVGGTADKHKYNLKDARDLDAAFRLVFNGGWTHTSTGAAPNGTNAYADTKLKPSLQLSQDDVHLSYYSRSDVRDKSCIDIGVDTDPAFYINYNYNGFNFKGLNRSQSLIGSLFNPTTGLFIGSRLSSSTEKYYHLGSLVDTLSESSSGLPTENIYIGAIWSRFFSGAGEFSNRETAWASIGSGLSDTDASNLYTLVQAFQTALSRNV